MLAGVLLSGPQRRPCGFLSGFCKAFPGRLAFDQLVLGCCLTRRWSHPGSGVDCFGVHSRILGGLVFSTHIYSLGRRLGMGFHASMIRWGVFLLEIFPVEPLSPSGNPWDFFLGSPGWEFYCRAKVPSSKRGACAVDFVPLMSFRSTVNVSDVSMKPNFKTGSLGALSFGTLEDVSD